jgi:alkylation response protein AidB-like acyl-CoA dehydrogenase
MDFALSDDQLRFRDELRAWLAAHRPPHAAIPGDVGRSAEHPGADAMLEWAKLLSRGRWLGLAWPRAYGGRGLGLVEQMIFYDETAPFDPPQLGQMVSLGVVGPTLLRYGSDAQKQRFLPRILGVDDVWCLGFSEPGSGSDLASLRTTAIADGDHFVLSGSKIWTSHAAMAQWCFVLARTEAGSKRHHGLGVFLMEMSLPGVEVRPIHNLVGEPHFAQVFLNDVRVPRDCLVGAPGDGWKIVNGALAAERDLWVFEMSGELRTALGRTLGYAKRVATHEQPGHLAPSQRQALAQAWVELELLRLNGLRSVTAVLRGRGDALDASRHKISGSELAQKVAGLALELQGPFAQLAGRDPVSPDGGVAAHQYLTRRSSTLISGTSEVQRNILAQRALGLPRD